MDERDALLLALAESQHGYVARYDSRLAGIPAPQLRTRRRAGEWELEGSRVLRRTGVPQTKEGRLMRAVLDAGPGAFISHATAAAWWGLPGFDLVRVHVTRPRGVSGKPVSFGQVLHEVLDLTPDQVTVLRGIPIVRPERLAFELFGSVHPLRAGRAVETAWSKGLVSGASLRRVFTRLAGRGRAGTVAERDFLEHHPDDWVPPASNLERRIAHILAEAGLGRFRRQVDLGDDRWVGRVDFLHEELPLVVEVQSEAYHEAMLDKAHDAKRKAALEAAEFVVVEVWDTEIWYEREVVVDRVRQGRLDALRKLHQRNAA